MSENLRTPKPVFIRFFSFFAIFLAGFYWIVFVIYPGFFIFNPFADPSWIRQVTLLISLIGWLTIATLPAIVLVFYVLGSSKWLVLMPFSAILWPLSVILNQLVLLARDGRVYFDYLISYPVFIATDIALPMLLLVLYLDLRVQTKKYVRLARHEVQSRPYS